MGLMLTACRGVCVRRSTRFQSHESGRPPSLAKANITLHKHCMSSLPELSADQCEGTVQARCVRPVRPMQRGCTAGAYLYAATCQAAQLSAMIAFAMVESCFVVTGSV